MPQPNPRSGPRAPLGLALATLLLAVGCGGKLAETDTATVVADPTVPPSRPSTPAAAPSAPPVAPNAGGDAPK